MRTLLPTLVLLAAPVVGACNGAARSNEPRSDGVVATVQDRPLPPDAEHALAQLDSSARHGEYAMIAAGAGDSVRAFIVYPERSTKAPVVLVVHEIYGLTHWVRAVADQLAAEGFIAIAPDLLTGTGVASDAGGEPDRQAATAAVRALPRADVQRRLRAIANWGMALPAATRRYGIVGFCWGGGVAFTHAIDSDALGAAVVYYGTSPETAELAGLKAPVLGLYGGDDARVNATIPAADSALKALGRTYQPNLFEGAGHGFLRQLDGQEGANLRASREAWPKTVAWFRQYLVQ